MVTQALVEPGEKRDLRGHRSRHRPTSYFSGESLVKYVDLLVLLVPG